VPLSEIILEALHDIPFAHKRVLSSEWHMFVRKFKATSRICHRFIEILISCRLNVVTVWVSVPFRFSLPIIIALIIIIIIIIVNHLYTTYLQLYT
jgi:hypothetical protein